MAVGSAPLPDFFEIDGVRLGVAEAGIKKPGRKDLVLIELAAGGTCAGVFTQNMFCAPPVHIAKTNLSRDWSPEQATYLLTNTGNANAGTGPQGMLDAQACCAAVAEQFGVSVSQVLPFSTGVIGERLPLEKVIACIPAAQQNLSPDNWSRAAEGIMTTDTRPKGAARQIEYGGKTVSISGISKGAGMIKPNMATMLCYVATDASVSQVLLKELLSELAEKSFNRITVDGDTSTNDACMLLASGKSQAPAIDKSHPDFMFFKQTLQSVFIDLAQAIIRDAEGATKFVSVVVEQAASQTEALDVAYTIAHSPLIKTALYASDPNWGRILAAIGRSSIESLDLNRVSIYLGDVQIVEAGGRCASYTEERGQAVMDQSEITIRIVLERGSFSETIWTSDLSHEYVTVNAEYRT